MSTSNKALIFAKVPETFPVPGEDLVVKDLGFDPSSCPPDSINVEILYVSLDPYMRGRMRDPSVKSYFPGFQFGEPLANAGLARVIKSTSDEFKEGDIIKTMLPFQEYVNIKVKRSDDQQSMAAVPGKPEKVEVENGPDDIRSYLGVLGMPGLTAYSSLYEIGQPQKGETIFISSAAGAVGQLVGQLSKHAGLKVIGSVGTEDKLKYLTDELGFDGGFNYKTEDARDALKRLAPNGVDIYYDNVGGEQLDAALEAMNQFGRIVGCGMISQYNKKTEDRYGVKNLMLVVGKRLTFRGFIVADKDFGPKYAKDHNQNVGKWLKDGSFSAKVSEWQGIDQGGEAVLGMLKGENFGKAVLKVKA